MVLGGFGGMGGYVEGVGSECEVWEGTGGDGSNARKRGKCQACQCLIRVDRNWNGIGNSWKADGKKLEKVGKDWRTLGDWRGTAVMRGSAGNARLMSQMVYAICFSF